MTKNASFGCESYFELGAMPVFVKELMKKDLSLKVIF